MNACDLFDPARLPARGQDGRVTHPDLRLVVFVEDEVDVAPFFNGAGLQLRPVAHEFPDDDHDGVDLSWLTPEPPEGDGWRLASIHDNEDGEAIVWWTRYVGPASSTARIVGMRVIDGVHVIVAQPASRLLPDQLLVRYDDYLAATKPAAVAADEAAAFDAWFRGEQGTAYDGMWSFARAAWMYRAALSVPFALAERAKVVMPEWPGEGWNPMETAPRDGTLLRLLVDFTGHATEDSDRAPTIGSNSFDDTGEDVWQFAGWSWSQDCYTQGEGTPVGWLPMLDKEHHDRTVAPAPVAGEAALRARQLLCDVCFPHGGVGADLMLDIDMPQLGVVPTEDALTAIRAALAQDRAARAAGAEPDGACLISQERRRQVSAEGWSAEHDDAYTRLELVRAAVAYALYGVGQKVVDDSFWPWHLDWWKPSDRRRNLVKAGALIAAEIDRLHRVDAAHGGDAACAAKADASNE